ncbi:MAG: 16S rRNA (cytosine(1402)-N(4))-methyltransferase RsmH [Erysipelotrichaceae bacterium]|nr:16S rRNA (cytosine(1402)-N(4))-methyltransferase RsmH [Erysipelotrichaceae bacterium]
MEHQSVLLRESINNLQIKNNGIYVDGTLGRAGHSSLILRQLTSGHLYCFDKDVQALQESEKKLAAIGRNFTLINGDFSNLKSELAQYQVTGIDGLLLDIGVSSPQFDDPERGFSYRYDARLDMRMDQSQRLSAWEVVNTYPEKKLTDILYRFGEEKYARNIVRKILEQRALKPINTTLELVDVIRTALPNKILNQKGHPAKQTFQALRIEVNNELDALKKGLEEGLQLLNPDGRICVITFHSLEDRIVKQLFREYVEVDRINKKIPIDPQTIKESPFELITKKPIVAAEEELSSNNRSHSAKLRVIRKR